MKSVIELLRKHTAFLAFLVTTTAVRFINLRHSLYFIWDQGRDAVAIQRIVEGDLTLLGPTSGIAGFFLGPLWFYIGIPGYILSGANPYGISAWYIALSCLALPIYWFLAHRLFPQRRWAAIGLASALAMVSGSIHASIFIWNPLISLPLVAGAVYCLLRAREHRGWLVAGFFLFALTLQSEFAYAVFFLIPLFLLIPWMRQQRDWRDFAMVILAGAVTLGPQALSEILTRFSMTRALLASMRNPELRVAWLDLWRSRPDQLFQATRMMLVDNIPHAAWSAGALMLTALVTGIFIWRRSKHEFQRYEWRLISLLALLPYVFYMLWRGNYGYFFDYYLTPHFILLVPLIVAGMVWLWKAHWQLGWVIVPGQPLALFLAAAMALGSWQTIRSEIVLVENNAGLWIMAQAADRALDWQQADQIEQSTVKTYTPNIQTEHHDFVMQWRARSRGVPVPLTVLQPGTPTWYLIMEPPVDGREVLLQRWHDETIAGGVRTRQEKIGILTLETWVRATPSASPATR